MKVRRAQGVAGFGRFMKFSFLMQAWMALAQIPPPATRTSHEAGALAAPPPFHHDQKFSDSRLENSEPATKVGLNTKFGSKFEALQALDRIEAEESNLRQRYSSLAAQHAGLQSKANELAVRMSSTWDRQKELRIIANDTMNTVKAATWEARDLQGPKIHLASMFTSVMQRIEYNRMDSIQLQGELKELVETGTRAQPDPIARLFAEWEKFTAEQNETQTNMEAVKEVLEIAGLSGKAMYAQITSDCFSEVDKEAVAYARDDLPDWNLTGFRSSWAETQADVNEEGRPSSLSDNTANFTALDDQDDDGQSTVFEYSLDDLADQYESQILGGNATVWKALPEVLLALRKAKVEKATRLQGKTLKRPTMLLRGPEVQLRVRYSTSPL